MENVVLIIHLLLALALIGAVLLQRSEGGGLGIGGGGGGSGRVAGRSAGTAMGKVTWILAGAFICTSMALTIIAASNSAGGSVLDRLVDAPSSKEVPADAGTAPLQSLDDSDTDAPLLPTAE